MRLRTLLCALLLLVAPARSGFAEDSSVEVRLGVLWPAIGPQDARYPGTDVNAELLMATPFTGWTVTLPGWLRWMATPQLHIGGLVGTAGAAHQGYAGLTWTVPLAGGVLGRDDALSLGLSIGPDFIGGADAPHDLTEGPQLRLGAAIGYRVTPRVGLYVLFDHVSNGSLAHEGESINDLGMQVGLHF